VCLEKDLPSESEVFRIWGSDRYQTALAVSRLRFNDGLACKVTIASGRAFPDAITAAANLRHGPLLLVPGSSLPSSVRAEILRVKPDAIEIYGGRGVITPTVSHQLGALVGGVIIANGGTTRYGTAAVATYDEQAGSPVYIATGVDFPDALAASALIRRERAAFMLVGPDSIPAETQFALNVLKPSRIVVLGGTGAVSARVERALRTFTTGSVTRITGVDRFDTAVQIARTIEPGGSSEYTIVSGRAFPDALAAAALGGNPILLVEPDSIPDVVRELLLERPPHRITIIGGPGAVSESVAAELEGYLAD
jgi:putative cell wall-binding protein